ncbi:hypothetical protein [Psychromicrobium xiongbiense]|uniref:hypothetical protein n=1 Tax=Psychromicrobium xiongbiense TaxID=3051184 RepID=UPI0025564F58|nr:hypothetical protein [Psychromicrobium sp. YIM S02556]
MIDFAAIGLAGVRVLLVGLLLGAGLPALFALGMRLQSAGSGDLDTSTDADGAGTAKRQPLLLVLGWLVFAVVIAVVITGVLWITRQSIHHYFGITLFGGA